MFQGQIAALLLGGAPAGGLPEGLSIGMLLAFGGMLVLGFGLYASLYAGAASLVSRQEDVNSIIAPLTFLSVGRLHRRVVRGHGRPPDRRPDRRDPVVRAAVQPVPDAHPATASTPPRALEVIVAMALILVTIPLALWLAARLYRAGVLLYGQPPTPRTLWRALRSG